MRFYPKNVFTIICLSAFFCSPLLIAGPVSGWGAKKIYLQNPWIDCFTISAGPYYNVVIKENGSLAAWGDNTYGQCDAPAGNDFAAIAAGRRHCLALKTDGSLTAWGDNSKGQCDVPDGNDFVAIAICDSDNTYTDQAQKIDGTIVYWGQSDILYYDVPDPPADSNFIATAAGTEHYIGLKDNGWITAIGPNDFYGETFDTNSNLVYDISMGLYHGLALMEDGTVRIFGQDNLNQAQDPNGNDFVAVSAGWFHDLALRENGTILAWGDCNDANQLNAPAGNNFVAISAGGYHSLALTNNGEIIAWGGELANRNMYGDFNGDYIVDMADVADFLTYWMAQDCNDTAWLDLNGDCVINSYEFAKLAENFTAPQDIDFIHISAGLYHNLALRADGSITAWGNNRYGQSDPPENAGFTAISAGQWHSLAIDANGHIIAWGDNRTGQCDVPDGNDFIQVAAGDGHSLALKNDGSVVAWGWEDSGYEIAPQGQNFISIDAGYLRSLAVEPSTRELKFLGLKIFTNNWLKWRLNGIEGDYTGNNFVNFNDYAFFAADWAAQQ